MEKPEEMIHGIISANGATQEQRAPRRRRGRPSSIAKRYSIGLTEVQVAAVERQRDQMRRAASHAAPQGQSAHGASGEADAIRALLDAGIEAVSGEGAAGTRAGARGASTPPTGVPVVPPTPEVMKALAAFGEALASVEKALRHPLGTNVNQVARRVNADVVADATEKLLLVELVAQVRGLRSDVAQASSQVMEAVWSRAPGGDLDG